jgi:DNA-directed RNA polymerase subunit beta'
MNPSNIRPTIEEAPIKNFKAIRLTLASPQTILGWSHGEVTKPETINYRTQKPEKDGLFCEKIFGPTKDWECYCGKYKKIRYKGIVCDKCGVEVTRAIVRRENFGHIGLAAPVSHIWFLRGVPSKIGLILDLSMQDLEKVIYFASFIITKVDYDLINQTQEQIKNELKNKRKQIDREFELKSNEINQKMLQALATSEEKNKETTENKFIQEKEALINLKAEKLEILDNAAETAKAELKEIKPLKILSEAAYIDLSLKYGHVFEAGIGAEAIRSLLEKTNLIALAKELEEETHTAVASKQKKLTKRFKLAQSMIKTNIRPEWMILTELPVIPPDLRPMVQLEGGRFATSDLNDLYRRVINRNNRLKRLQELRAPEVIQRNEKRMLQEAVDALLDNGARRGKTVTASTGQKRQLKSIADMLKGKQGRFRANLLGKRIDYSGRSVIVIGPKLQMNQCGLPKTMALELFRPFVISQLIAKEIAHNVRSANRYIEQDHAEVWEILENITNQSYVLLNRAPTLHRLGIQAFQPVMIEGKAIQLHPLVCRAFNADFDGDQMAVHVPITIKAKNEAASLMMSTNNLLKPATGEPIITPDQDIVWGCFYLTFKNKNQTEPIKIFSDSAEAKNAYELGKIKIQDFIKVKIDEQLIDTTVGRLYFNDIIPSEIGFVNDDMNSKNLKSLVANILNTCGGGVTVKFLDCLKRLGYETITTSGLSWGISDIPVLTEKDELIKKGELEVEAIQDHYQQGLLTNRERYIKVVETWGNIKNEVTSKCQKIFSTDSSLYSIITSGARGSWAQLIQIMGMKGVVVNPAGEMIELPVKANFREGLDVLEFFISTHGTRKGLSDTALRTASAGYLTRRLVDVSQDVMVIENDCGDNDGLLLTTEDVKKMSETFTNLTFGRTTMKDIIHPQTKKVLVGAGELIPINVAEQLDKIGIDCVHIRSLMSCKSVRGVCQKCYGFDLAYNRLVKLGTAVGVIAAQSIGEPGTQLTMRTFHTGGVAGGDITQGLPRVEELFECRPPKRKAVLSPVAGQVIIDEQANATSRNQRLVKIKYQGKILERHALSENLEIIAKNNKNIKAGDVLLKNKNNDKTIVAENTGRVEIINQIIRIVGDEDAFEEVIAPAGLSLWVKNGDLINAGDPLTEGSVDLQELFHHKGQLAVQKYIIKEIQYIYSSQGQKLNMKHIEIIVKQMFSRLYIEDAGDTGLLPGEIVTRSQYIEENNKAEAENKQLATGKILLLGITKASLTTDSFLSAASFQETARVLIDAAITGKVDNLRGLKENVIIGKLIPAGTGFNLEEKTDEEKVE